MRLTQLNHPRLAWTLPGAIAALLFSAAAFAQVQMTPAERMMQRSAGPDEYLFFEDDRKTVVDYKEDHIVRICVSENRHLVPVAVHYDGKKGEVHPGDCMRVEAKKIALEPAERLEANWSIRAEVDTVS